MRLDHPLKLSVTLKQSQALIRKAGSMAVIAMLISACGGPADDIEESSSVSSSSSSLNSSSSSLPSSSSTPPVISSSSSSSASPIETLTLQENTAAVCTHSGAVETEHEGFTGAGFINTDNAIGVEIVWAVNAENAGDYDFSARYANGGDASRGGELKVDESGDSLVLNMASTGDWTNWQDEQGSVRLAQGNNIIRLVASTSGGVANFDSFSIQGSGLSVGDCSDLLADINGAFPKPGASGINPDTYLRIQFDSAPTLNSGFVEIYDGGTRVDQINVGADQERDKVGSRVRRDGADLITTLAHVVGNTVIIDPHQNSLSYGRTYSVRIASGVISGRIGGENFNGIAAGEWQFSTKASGPSSSTVTVDDDGPSDFSSVQGAFNYIMSNHGGNQSAQISIKSGTYPGLLALNDKSNLHVIGENRDTTRVIARNGNSLNPGDDTRSLFAIKGGDLNTFEGFTIHNTIPRGTGGQAEALYYNSGGRVAMVNMAYISEQDTILTKGNGYAWFYNSLIAGNVDFIWGSPKVTLFENSEIRSLGDSAAPGSDQGGYVVQSRTPAGGLGFVFLNSRFTRAAGPAGNTPGNGKSSLGRGAAKTDTFDSAAYVNCQMDSHIKSTGFDTGRTLNPSYGSATNGYREYGSTTLSGGSINLGSRYQAHIMSSSEVNQYYRDRATIFSSGGTSWNPSP